ncbi:MAG: hypothetical protein MHPSP_000234, partial [Paramarteilia canceri]
MIIYELNTRTKRDSSNSCASSFSTNSVGSSQVSNVSSPAISSFSSPNFKRSPALYSTGKKTNNLWCSSSESSQMYQNSDKNIANLENIGDKSLDCTVVYSEISSSKNLIGSFESQKVNTNETDNSLAENSDVAMNSLSFEDELFGMDILDPEMF